MSARSRAKQRRLSAHFFCRPVRTRIMWVPHIANLAAPTVAELNAGMEISRYLTLTGFPT